jgi:adenine deaminase
MKVMMRYGSAWHDVAAQVKAITEHGLSPRVYFLWGTDDSQSETLISRRAYGQGAEAFDQRRA